AALCLAGCGPKKVAVDPGIAARATLERADANLRAGCFDCLSEALRQYESARNVAVVAEAATRGAVRASILLALRERELGTTDSGYVERARQLASASAAVQTETGPLIEIVDVMPWRVGVGRPGRPDTSLTVYLNRQERTETLRGLAGRDEVSAYVWIDYACASGAGVSLGEGGIRAPVSAFTTIPLIEFALITCRSSGGARRPPQGIDAVPAAAARSQEIPVFNRLA